MQQSRGLDETRLDAMMNKYKEEIMRLQQAKPPVHNMSVRVGSVGVTPGERGEWLRSAGQEPLSEPISNILDNIKKPEAIKPKSKTLAELITSILPPRIAFSSYIAANGKFIPYKHFSALCYSSFFKTAKPLRAFARFSSDLDQGDCDARRAERMLELTLSNNEEQCSFLAFSMPVSPIRNSEDLPSLLHSKRRNPKTGLMKLGGLWEFVSEHPESLFWALSLFSDTGTPKSYRTLKYFTMPFYMEPQEGNRIVTRLIFTPKTPAKPLNRFEVEELCGYGGNPLANDFIAGVEGLDGVVFEVFAQVISLNHAQALSFVATDPTVMWSENDFPPILVGELTLDSMADYEKECDCYAFSPSCLVEGISLPLDSLYPEVSKIAEQSHQYRLIKEVPKIETVFKKEEFKVNAKDDIARLTDHLTAMNERERRWLADNLSEELALVEAVALEKLLMLIGDADLAFAQLLTRALEG